MSLDIIVFGEIHSAALRCLSLQRSRFWSRGTSQRQETLGERLIGSIRRECLDHIVALDEHHLRRIRKSYFAYYNRARTHLALNKDAPIPRPIISASAGQVVAIPEVGGLHHRYERLAT